VQRRARRHREGSPIQEPLTHAPALAAGPARPPAGSCRSRRGACWHSGAAPPQASACTASSEARGPRRHLDTNGDGLVSETELRAALGELGAGAHAPAAAQELVGLAAGGLGGRGVSFADWSQFVRRLRGHRTLLPARRPRVAPGSQRPARCLQALPERQDARSRVSVPMQLRCRAACCAAAAFGSWLCQAGRSRRQPWPGSSVSHSMLQRRAQHVSSALGTQAGLLRALPRVDQETAASLRRCRQSLNPPPDPGERAEQP